MSYNTSGEIHTLADAPNKKGESANFRRAAARGGVGNFAQGA